MGSVCYSAFDIGEKVYFVYKHLDWTYTGCLTCKGSKKITSQVGLIACPECNGYGQLKALISISELIEGVIKEIYIRKNKSTHAVSYQLTHDNGNSGVVTVKEGQVSSEPYKYDKRGTIIRTYKQKECYYG